MTFVSSRTVMTSCSSPSRSVSRYPGSRTKYAFRPVDVSSPDSTPNRSVQLWSVWTAVIMPNAATRPIVVGRAIRVRDIGPPRAHGARSSVGPVFHLPLRQPLQRVEPVGAADLRLVHRIAQPLHRLIVHHAVHGVGMSVLAAVREAEPRRILHARGGAVDDVGHHGQRAHRVRANAGNGKQLLEVARARLVG